MAGDVPIWPEELFGDIDRNGPVPLYYQVSSRLENAIITGALPAGARLENELAIAARLGISRPTIRRAIQEVVDKGLLVRRRGIGTQVVQGQVTRPVELTSFFEDLVRTHHAPGTSVLDRRVMQATDEIAGHLGIAPGSDIAYFRRLRSTDGVAVAILENYMPVQFAEITAEQLQERGLYQILRAKSVTIRVAKQKIGARRALKEESDLLSVDKGGPVLTMERVAFDQAGQAIEFGHHCYRPDMYSFETTLVAK